MTTNAASSATPIPSDAVLWDRPSDLARPSRRRRAALVLSGVLVLALPLLWGLGSLVALLTGHEADHRFHQLTGEGVLLHADEPVNVRRVEVCGAYDFGGHAQQVTAGTGAKLGV